MQEICSVCKKVAGVASEDWTDPGTYDFVPLEWSADVRAAHFLTVTETDFQITALESRAVTDVPDVLSAMTPAQDQFRLRSWQVAGLSRLTEVHGYQLWWSLLSSFRVPPTCSYDHGHLAVHQFAERITSIEPQTTRRVALLQALRSSGARQLHSGGDVVHTWPPGVSEHSLYCMGPDSFESTSGMSSW